MDHANKNLKPGSTDSAGNTVSRVLATDEAKNYAIWETTTGKVLVDGDGDALASKPEISAWVIKIGSLISRQKGLKGIYNEHIAYAYKLCFDGNSDGALEALKTTYNTIRDRINHERRSRAAYLFGSMIVACGSGWLWLHFPNHELPGDSSHRVLSGLAVSALGAFMSVATGLKEHVGTEEKIFMNIVYGALRLIVGIIAGFVAILMMETGVALTFLQQQSALGGFLLATFLAGYSERLIASSLRQIEATAG